MKAPPFDLLKDFTPASVIAGTTLLPMASKESQIDSVPALVAAAKKRPAL